MFPMIVSVQSEKSMDNSILGGSKSPFVAASVAKAFSRQRRYAPQGIVCECCIHSCEIAEFLTYCWRYWGAKIPQLPVASVPEKNPSLKFIIGPSKYWRSFFWFAFKIFTEKMSAYCYAAVFYFTSSWVLLGVSLLFYESFCHGKKEQKWKK